MSTVLPDSGTSRGVRVRERLRDEQVIWLVTVGADGTPQPNPIWFLWEGTDSVLVYSAGNAHRLAHIRARPRVSLHFNSDDRGDDIFVLHGQATIVDDVPPADESADYLAKYGSAMVAVIGSQEAFAQRYSAPIRIQLDRVR